MAKVIEKDGKKYRIRRGKLVEIPEEWVGKHVYRRTYKAREEKQETKKANKRTRGGDKKP